MLSHNCGTSLAAGQSCAILVQFQPTITGSLTGAVTITDNASNPNQTLALSGTGNDGHYRSVSVTPASLSFASQNVNTTSAVQSITVKNTGTATLTLSGRDLVGSKWFCIQDVERMRVPHLLPGRQEPSRSNSLQLRQAP